MILGVTGGIGSGKSLVCRIFSVMGIPVFEADAEAKKILMSDPHVMKNLHQVFGDEAFTDGVPDRKKIAAIVFTDPGKLQKLNGIIHPAVANAFDTWMKDHMDASFVIREAAILIESGSYKTTDKVLVVTASEETRVQRVMKRDKVTAEQVRARMKNQLSEQERLSYADFVINNDGHEMLIPQVLKVYNQLAK